MRITVQFETQLRDTAGTSRTDIQVPAGCSIEDAVNTVAEQFGHPLRGRLLTDDGSPQRSVLFFVNDHAVAHSAISVQRLADGDVLLLFLPISGG